MTLDQSLRIKRGAGNARAVLTRAERITRLQSEDKWTEGQSPLGLPKVRVFKLSLKKKKVKKAEDAADAKGGAKGAAAKPAAKAAGKK